MPYFFPYEPLFLAGVGVLILGLLVLRFRLARRRRARAADPSGGNSMKESPTL